VFSGALFLFNGLMQIPGRENRRTALRELHRACAPGARLLISTHDRDFSPAERAMWRLEAARWVRGEQDARLLEFGDRYFEDEVGRTFMHLPDRTEVLADLTATGWTHEFDAMRGEIAKESRAVRDFSDECRFWVAGKK
jgi:SAM-dependent methyltransferase